MSNTAAAVEVLVIGGGVIGSSIAYHVARQGRNVLVHVVQVGSQIPNVILLLRQLVQIPRSQITILAGVSQRFQVFAQPVLIVKEDVDLSLRDDEFVLHCRDRLLCRYEIFEFGSNAGRCLVAGEQRQLSAV